MDKAKQPQDDSKPGHLLNVTLAGLPELEGFDNDAQRQAALREIGEEAADFKSGGYWLGVAILVGGTVICWWVSRWTLARLDWPRWIEEIVRALAIGGGFWCVLRWLHRSGARGELRRKLLAQGVPVCLKCGYLLRGLTVSAKRCPECGADIGRESLELIRASGTTPGSPDR